MTVDARPGQFWTVNYAGFVIVAASVLGGGAGQGYWTDHVVEILMLPALFMGMTNLGHSRFEPAGRAFALFVLVFLALQFLPVSTPKTLPAFPGLDHLELWTVSAEKSLNSAAYLACLVGFGLYISLFRDDQHQRLIKFVFLGLAINMLIGLIQLSYSSNTAAEGYLPFIIRSGLFSNENHLSAFVFVTIPLVAWRFLSFEARPLVYIAATLMIVGFLFAVGSRAGMALSAGLSVFCLFWFMLARQPVSYRLGYMALGAAIFLFAMAQNGMDTALEGDLRLLFFKNTVAAIKDHWLFGTGLGTFTLVYPYYQPDSEIINVYANHAHNDLLEFYLEGGLLSGLILVAGFFLVVKNMFRSPLAQAGALSIFAIAIHSIVDYPLRTFANAATLTMLFAIVLSARPAPIQNEAPAAKRGY
jgi:O-antigen ligase